MDDRFAGTRDEKEERHEALWSFRLNETWPGEGREPESSINGYLQSLWIPVFTGMTTFYETVNLALLKLFRPSSKRSGRPSS
ncbi:MAG: hypothetical protein CVU57_27975 [Deltaproteobacteria bacterium HGW-Deltaproteobacteria-15]|jgi:hypothetical protein|nr:MAG: hypothetical protein CVU57_27975 [Deltaproteobacteria bacterium HGW-Deltaproteobacteria-15]